MISSEISFRVRYNEVDQMGFVHHGNYAAYFEMGRTELMRKHGISYKEMEEKGVILPLSEFFVKYYQPAKYDDELILLTCLIEFSGVRLIFEYTLKNTENQVLAIGKTPLVFADAITKKPVRPPDYVKQMLAGYF